MLAKPPTQTETVESNWWAGRRLSYNVLLVLAGLAAFVGMAILGETVCAADPDFEITAFTIAFQAVGYAVAIAIANVFYGDAANYAVSLFVVGMALRFRAYAALGKGISMGLFGLWVTGTVIWHALHGTLPSAITMGAVGLAAFAANAASFVLLWAYRAGDANMRSS